MAGASLPGSSYDIKIDVPELTGDNFKVWKKRVLLHLGFTRFDYAIQHEEPAEINKTSTPDEVDHREKWEKSNYICTMFIKTKLCASIRGSVEQHTKVRDLLKAIDEQFETSDKALASTLIMKFTSLKLNATNGVRDFIMRMRDIAAQLKEEGRLLLEEGEKVNLTTSTNKESSSTKKGHHKDKGKGKMSVEPTIKKESSCFFCKKKGHMKKDCIKFKAWLKKKGYDKPTETSGK
ncbi:uncharacterized protein LOC141634435 isoform X2 [Silene latifolia]|uniref:uncharacterized protein LOC141634435 isoform X2 n=1 Tax=Silene latifolia TaxID=37657 RepID=UPI003D774AC2